jgi:hypothetical protein
MTQILRLGDEMMTNAAGDPFRLGVFFVLAVGGWKHD